MNTNIDSATLENTKTLQLPSGTETNHNDPFAFPVIDPWPEPVDAIALLDELAATIKRFVVLPPCAAETLALCMLHTYAFTYRDVSTYIGIESPEKRWAELVHHPVTAANISSSAFFRVIHETQPTLQGKG